MSTLINTFGEALGHDFTESGSQEIEVTACGHSISRPSRPPRPRLTRTLARSRRCQLGFRPDLFGLGLDRQQSIPVETESQPTNRALGVRLPTPPRAGTAGLFSEFLQFHVRNVMPLRSARCLPH